MTVLVTGAAGSIGTVLRERLPGFGWTVRAFDRVQVPGGMVGDLASPADLDTAVAGVSAIVHLAGVPTERPWPQLRDANVDGLVNLFEAARRARVSRVVYASTNHVTGFTPVAPELPADAPARPDTLYGVTKAFGEALARYYVDRYGLQVACLRIGTFAEVPTNVRTLSTWLSPADATRLVDACLRAPALTYSVVWGVSANTRRTWSLDAGRALGYEPVDDAERYADGLPDPEPDPTDGFVGGGFTSAGFGIDEAAHRTRVTDLRAEVAAWLDDEVDPAAAAELQELLDSGAHAELADRFSGSLVFGTAGLRGPLRAGPNGMNRTVVRRTAAGLAGWLHQHGFDGRVVVIGFDARFGSADFARDSAGILAAAGFDARLMPHVTPTPVLAFAVQRFGAAAGVMVTASHNPPEDNGYKVYAADGAQIVPPTDVEIEAASSAVGPAREIALDDAAVTVLDEAIVREYVDAVVSLVPAGPRDLRIVHTALHGVGTRVVRAVLAEAGFTDVVSVAEQAEPDPQFPTVAFPNPEEPGALDLALALAAETDADLVIANDPDADRCALAVRDEDATWRMLRGDEVGVLLADAMLGEEIRGTYATTIVSSSLLGELARRSGVGYAETLTGFKWISRAAPDLVYGYEEALGYAVAPHLVRDKDGISAALRCAHLAASLKAAGTSLTGRLDALAAQYGRYVTDQVSIRVEAVSEIETMMTRLRASPPATLLGHRPEVDDLLPDADVLRWRWAGGRVVIRPSGTEPKLKAYLEVIDASGSRARADTTMRRLRAEVAAVLGT